MAQRPKHAREQPPSEEDDLVHPIGNDGSVACGVFLLLARRHVSGDVHPTQDLALCMLHMLWASVDNASPMTVARQSFLRLATKGAVSLTNASGAATVPSHKDSPIRRLASICHGPRASTIVRIDTEGHTGVTAIGDDFLDSCCNLLSVNLRGLNNVVAIGGSFLDVDLNPRCLVAFLSVVFDNVLRAAPSLEPSRSCGWPWRACTGVGE